MEVAEVEAVWRKSDRGRTDRRNTVGILRSMATLVLKWRSKPLTREDLESLYLIGDRPDSNWAKWSDGTFRVSRCRVPGDEPFREGAPVNLVAVEGLGRRVLLDGDRRAVALWRRGGDPPPGSTLYVGELNPDFLALVQPIFPLWLP